MATVQTAPCGRAPDGTPVERITLANASGLSAVLLSWGATRARLRQHLVQHATVRFDPTGQVCCHGPFGQGD